MNDELNIIETEVIEEVKETATISENEISENKEKVLEKVETKKNTKKNKQAKSTKECPVLVYNKAKHFIIISFEGLGIRIDGIMDNPGNTVEVKYSGEIGTPNFKLEVK